MKMGGGALLLSRLGGQEVGGCWRIEREGVRVVCLCLADSVAATAIDSAKRKKEKENIHVNPIVSISTISQHSSHLICVYQTYPLNPLS